GLPRRFRGCAVRTAMFTLKLPSGADDLLLQFSQTGGSIALLAGLFRGLSIHSLPFAKDLFERTDFAEEQVAGCAAELAIRTNIVGPKEPGNELIRLNAEVFELEQMLEGTFFFAGDGVTKLDEFGFLAGDCVTQTISLHSEVVPYRSFERNLLQWR